MCINRFFYLAELFPHNLQNIHHSCGRPFEEPGWWREKHQNILEGGIIILKYNKNGHQIFATYFLNSTLHRNCCLENIFDFEGTFPLCSTICCCIKLSTLSRFKSWCGYNHTWTQFRSARLCDPQKSLCPETGHRIWLFYFSLLHLFWT